MRATRVGGSASSPRAFGAARNNPARLNRANVVFWANVDFMMPIPCPRPGAWKAADRSGLPHTLQPTLLLPSSRTQRRERSCTEPTHRVTEVWSWVAKTKLLISLALWLALRGTLAEGEFPLCAPLVGRIALWENVRLRNMPPSTQYGIERVRGRRSFAETLKQFEGVLIARGLTIFAQIAFSDDAA